MRFRIKAPPGTAPGTIVIDPAAAKPRIRVIAYGPDELIERELDSPAAVPEMLGRWPVVWINVDGLGDAAVLQEIGSILNLHRLALEDVVNVHQRPKVEPYDEHLYIVMRMLTNQESMAQEQLSLFLGRNFVLTFQEHPGDGFDQVRQRLRQQNRRIRSAGADYLAYALLDAVIDGFFPPLERSGDELDEVEAGVMARPDEAMLHRIRSIKRDLLAYRRVVWPLRETVNSLIRDGGEFITSETSVYLRDCYDHVIRLIDIIESYRELASGLMDLYLSQLSNRMNEVMKVLTIFAAIFIPLGFLAGLYGMNFNPEKPGNMPETQWPFGYVGALVLMAVVAAALLLYFWRKGWIGSSRERP